MDDLFNEKTSQTPPQDDVYTIKLKPQGLSRQFPTLSAIPEFNKKLKKMDELAVRRIFYLLFQEKSRSKQIQYDDVMKRIANFSSFDFDTDVMKSKVLTDGNIWGKENLTEVCDLLSLETKGNRSELVNNIFRFLNNFGCAEGVKAEVIEETIGSESKKKACNEIFLNKKLGDSELIQARLNKLPISKVEIH